MRRAIWIGPCVAAGLLVAPFVTFGAEKAGIESRLMEIERRLANLQRLVDVDLSDDAAVSRAVADRDAMRQELPARHVMSMLQTIRSQLELYQVQHGGEYPDLLVGWAQFTGITDTQGRILPDTAEGYGPYLQSTPVNPVTNSSRVVKAGSVLGEAGWVYESKTGQIRAVVPSRVAEHLGLNAQDVATY